MAKAKKIESNLLDELLGPVDPLAYAQVRNTMMLAKKLDKAREDKGWSKAEFARKMGREQSEVTKWLSGTHNFGVRLLTELEMKLGIRLLNVQEEEDVHELLLMGYAATFRAEGTITGWQGREPHTETVSRILFGTTTVGQQGNSTRRNGLNVN